MWIRVVNLAIGIWLMASPAVLGYGGAVADFHRIVGPTAAASAVIAMAQATRSVRWVNLLLGMILVGGAWLLDAGTAARVVGIACGVTMAVFAIPAGQLKHELGGGWRVLVRRGPD